MGANQRPHHAVLVPRCRPTAGPARPGGCGAGEDGERGAGQRDVRPPGRCNPGPCVDRIRTRHRGSPGDRPRPRHLPARLRQRGLPPRHRRQRRRSRDGLSAVAARRRQPDRWAARTDRRSDGRHQPSGPARAVRGHRLARPDRKTLSRTPSRPPSSTRRSARPAPTRWAHRFLADFDARGQVVRDGSDLPRLGRAQKIVALATAFHVKPTASV